MTLFDWSISQYVRTIDQSNSGVLSSFLYLVYINDVFNQLETYKLGTSVCSIYSGNTALADDIALIAISPKLLQNMLDILNAYSKQWKFDLNKSKTRSYLK